MDGLLIVDKPEGMTSADVVRVAKRTLRCRTGHLGTLDPFASGVLPICLGEGTKIAQFLNTADKVYTGRIQLGRSTDSGDRTGSVTECAAVPALECARLQAVAAQFYGESLQVPPMHSALKRDGTPLYKLARRGIVVEREPRPIRIDRLDLRRVATDSLEFCVACSKGTYIRVLAQDIAAALGTVGHVTVLRRTKFGPFTEEEATAVSAIERPGLRVLGLSEALAGMPAIRLDDAASERARQGYTPLLHELPEIRGSERARLVDGEGQLIAVVVRNEAGRWTYGRVFSGVPAQ